MLFFATVERDQSSTKKNLVGVGLALRVRAARTDPAVIITEECVKKSMILLSILSLGLSAQAAKKAVTGTPSNKASVASTDSSAAVTSETQISTSGRTSMIQIIPFLGVTGSSVDGIKDKDGKEVGSSLGGSQAGMQVLVGSGKFQFESGLQYAERGYAVHAIYIKNGQDAGSLDVEAKMKYLEVPLLARLNISERSLSHLYLKGGVVVASLQSAKVTGNIQGVSVDKDIKDNYKSTQARGLIGIGYDARLSSNMAWTFGADYQRSLEKINKEGDDSLRSTSIGLMTGLSIEL